MANMFQLTVKQESIANAKVR